MNAGHRLSAKVLDGGVDFAEGYRLFASHPLQIGDHGVQWVLPKGQEGWSVLAVAPRACPTRENIEEWWKATVATWSKLASTNTYEGPYEAQASTSLRQLRMLIFESTGAVAASATAGLPEVIGGERNYDYRYAWLRDTAMIVRAMLKTASGSNEGEKFLQFVDAARAHASRDPINVVVTVDGRPVPDEKNPSLAGYRDSRPVRIGNRATHQLQLGAMGNFLLAAAEIYRERGIRDWATTEAIADFLVGHWREPDSGMWEASKPRQFTASKVFAACGLQAIAPFARGEGQAKFRSAAAAIHEYVMSRCLTSAGAFAAFEGFEGVDVSTALYPVWSFCAPDSPEMLATMEIIHRDFERDGLFRRDDQTPEHQCEGAFLPATFWVSQYWATRGDCERARRYIDAGLRHANDLGLFPEEIDWSTGEWLGNIPLGMTHASFLNAVADLSELERRLQGKAHVPKSK
jgi:GH15 family glucan-1,4-alpha-glucosidase